MGFQIRQSQILILSLYNTSFMILACYLMFSKL